MKKGIKLFEQQKVRTHWDEKVEKWYFSISDVIAILTESIDPLAYWRKLKERLKKEGNETVTNSHGLKMKAADGKMRMTDVADTEQLLRLIQSIPSPKAEPFKLWLAQVGSDRLNEIENPELAAQRTRELYKLEGYPDDWIEKRMRSIAIREELTEEWSKNDVKLQKEYAILTAEISKATFGIAPSQHKKVEGLKHQNLRDHMNDLELIFSMLGEASTTAIVKTRKPKGFIENKKVAKQGGAVAGNARKELETKTGTKVVSNNNFLPPSKKQKKLK